MICCNLFMTALIVTIYGLCAFAGGFFLGKKYVEQIKQG
jgi:uncharacterized protein YneF (UPF0154 family)